MLRIAHKRNNRSKGLLQEFRLRAEKSDLKETKKMKNPAWNNITTLSIFLFSLYIYIFAVGLCYGCLSPYHRLFILHLSLQKRVTYCGPISLYLSTRKITQSKESYYEILHNRSEPRNEFVRDQNPMTPIVFPSMKADTQ